MAKNLQAQLGGFWFAIIGAPLAAWWLVTFWIGPLLGISYAINIQTLLTFANPEAILIFIALWFGIALGYFGAASFARHGKR